MDYFEISFVGYPNVAYEEVSASGSRFTDINGNTVDAPTQPYPCQSRSWCVVRREWMQPLPVEVKQDNMVTTRIMIAKIGLPMTDSILTSLELASSQIPMLKRVLSLLSPAEGGINFAHPQTIGMIAQLEQVGVLTGAQATALRSL